jgi:hypothetical protein
MKALPIGAALAALSIGIAVAQTTPSSQSSTAQPGMNQPGMTQSTGTPSTGHPTGSAAPNGTTSMAPGAAMGNGNANGGGTAAASGNNNQAVATTNANAPTPAKGHNSFTMGQARTRIQKNGFQNVAGLKKDNDGIWRGTAQKDGQQVNVWLDYKGNVGSGQQ